MEKTKYRPEKAVIVLALLGCCLIREQWFSYLSTYENRRTIKKSIVYNKNICTPVLIRMQLFNTLSSYISGNKFSVD